MGKNNWFEKELSDIKTKIENGNQTKEDMFFLKCTIVQTYLFNHTFLNDADRNLRKNFEPLESTNKYLFDWNNMPSDEDTIACYKFYIENWRIIDWANTGWMENEKSKHPLGIYNGLSLCIPPEHV